MKKLVIFSVVMVLALAGAAFAQTDVVVKDNVVPIALGSGATAVAVPVDDSLNGNKINTSSGEIVGRDTLPVNTDSYNKTDVDVKVKDSLNGNKLNSGTINNQKTDVDVKVKDSLNGNNLASDNATINNQKTDVEVKNSLNNNKVALGALGADSGQIAGRDTHPVLTNAYNDNSNQGNTQNNTNIQVVDNAILANVNVLTGATPVFTDVNNTNVFIKSQHAEIGGSFNGATGVSNVNSAAGNLNSQTAGTTVTVGTIQR